MKKLFLFLMLALMGDFITTFYVLNYASGLSESNQTIVNLHNIHPFLTIFYFVAFYLFCYLFYKVLKKKYKTASEYVILLWVFVFLWAFIINMIKILTVGG